MDKRGPLDDAIAVLCAIRDKYPVLNGEEFRFGKFELTVKDGVVYSFGPNPYLVRGKDFHIMLSVDIS